MRQAGGLFHTKTVLFTGVCVLANVGGNFFLSWGLRRGALDAASPWSYLSVLFQPWVALGVALLVVWLTSRMALLSWADLSFVLPVTSIGYVLNALMGRFFLGEQVSLTRWAATLLIVAGSALVGLTPHRTAPGAKEAG
jgi:uncharacterized membrane protein